MHMERQSATLVVMMPPVGQGTGHCVLTIALLLIGFSVIKNKCFDYK